MGVGAGEGPEMGKVREGKGMAGLAGSREAGAIPRLLAQGYCGFLGLALAGAALPVRSLTPPRPGLSLVRLEVDANDRDAGKVVRRILQEKLPGVCLATGHYRLPARTDPKLFALLQSELKFQARMVDPAEAKTLGRMAGVGVFMVAEGDLKVGLRGCDLKLTIRLIDVESSDTVRVCTVHGHGGFHLDPARSGEEAAAAVLDAFAIALQSNQDPKENS